MGSSAAERLASGIWRLMDRYTSRAAARWAAPARALLEAEGRRAAELYGIGGERAAMEAPSEEAWLAYLTRVWLAEAPAGGAIVSELVSELKASGVDPIAKAAIQWAKRFGPERAAQITASARRIIADQVRIGIDKGETQAEIAGRIRKHYKTISANRARTIARTTVHAAVNFGSMTAAENAPVPLSKVWLALADGRTRDSHTAAHSQKQPMGNAFSVGGYPLNFPGDSSLGAPIEETINCRCSLGYERAAKAPARPRRAA